MHIAEATRAAIIAARARSAAVMREWHGSAAWRRADEAFAASGDCADRAAEAAEALLADADWAEALLMPLLHALSADPLFEPALRFRRDAAGVGAVLFDCPTASITARVRNAAALAMLPQPQTVLFTGRRTVTRVIRAGGAAVRRWRMEAATAPAGAVPRPRSAGLEPLCDGVIFQTDGATEAYQIYDATSDVVTMVATIRCGAAPLLREYSLATGALVRAADGDDRPSRTAMLLRFLREAGRADAASCFEQASRAPDVHLRWAAMREWLALDAARAAPRLAAMAAADPSDEIRTAATCMLPLVAARIEQCRA